jgi:predicted nucleic acid-binding protein
MSRVFADAFFYLALLSERDAAHRRAAEIYRSGEITGTVTTVAVLLEVADGLGGTPRRERCGAFLASVWSRPGTMIVSLSDTLVQRGLKLYRDRPDKAWSLTDCISFVVMADEGLTEALTGDRHFEQAGFKALLA